MNFIVKLLWKWQGRSKLDHENTAIQYTAVTQLGKVGSESDIERLLDLCGHDEQLIRNAASNSIRSLIANIKEDKQKLLDIELLVSDRFQQSNSLPEKLSLIEAMRELSLEFREGNLGDLVNQSENDLQYAIISSLEDTHNTEILDDILDASETEDMVLRHIALQTWYSGIERQDLDEVLKYCTPRLHYLIRASYELQTEGEFLRNVLSYANKNELPRPKAYPEFMIRYITELMGKWEYDPEAFRSLHAIMVPSYFTFESTEPEEERPYIVL